MCQRRLRPEPKPSSRITSRGTGIAWEYEALPGLKKPDYVIPYASGKCVVEVKQIEDADPRPTHGF